MIWGSICKVAVLGAVVSLASSPVAAQSLRHFDHGTAASDYRAELSLTFRLGGGGHNAPDAPRLALAAGMLQPRENFQYSGGQWRQLLGFSKLELEFPRGETPHLLINGTPLNRSDQRFGLDTGETILVVAGGILALGGVAVLAVNEALDCDESEECN